MIKTPKKNVFFSSFGVQLQIDRNAKFDLKRMVKFESVKISINFAHIIDFNSIYIGLLKFRKMPNIDSEP